MNNELDYQALPANASISVAHPMPLAVHQALQEKRDPTNDRINPPFQSLSDFQALLVEQLKNSSWHTISLYDPDFSPFASKVVVEALHDYFLRSRSNTLRAVLRHPTPLRRDFARAFNLLSQFAHVCSFYVLANDMDVEEDAFVLLGTAHVFWRPHRERMNGRFYPNNRENAAPFAERFESLIAASEAFGFNALGL